MWKHLAHTTEKEWSGIVADCANSCLFTHLRKDPRLLMSQHISTPRKKRTVLPQSLSAWCTRTCKSLTSKHCCKIRWQNSPWLMLVLSCRCQSAAESTWRAHAEAAVSRNGCNSERTVQKTCGHSNQIQPHQFPVSGDGHRRLQQHTRTNTPYFLKSERTCASDAEISCPSGRSCARNRFVAKVGTTSRWRRKQSRI